MNEDCETAKEAQGKGARGPSVAGFFSRLGRFLPETLVVAALLFLIAVLVIAFRGHRQVADRLPPADRATGEATLPETVGESEISPLPIREALPGDVSDPAELWEFEQRPPDTPFDPHLPPLLRGTGQDWLDASDEARRETARIVARWMHATATEEQQREFAEHYRAQLDRLSQQPGAGSGRLGDWIPLIHAHLVADEVWGPLGAVDRN